MSTITFILLLIVGIPVGIMVALGLLKFLFLLMKDLAGIIVAIILVGLVMLFVSKLV